jgi:NADH dehydrogenase FAD-containing subunit
MSDVQQNAFTMKSLNDAINLRNHVVYLLEQSDQLPSNYATDTTTTSSNITYNDLQKRLLTFVIVGATANSVKLSNGNIIPTKTIVWSGGGSPNSLITNLPCQHDKSGRVVVDKYLEIPQFKGVYAVGDCAYITEPYTGKSCPPTAQHAIREGAVVAKNIISAIEEEDWMTERHLITKQKA